jgi:hypothetical protein
MLPIQRLNLTFLVNAKDKRPVGRREVKADDITHLVDEQRIVRQLESLAAVPFARGRPIAPLVLSAQERAYLERKNS